MTTQTVFRKVLVANRGEIAVRAFRAAYELGSHTVAVFPYEDRGSEHRLKADEAYQIGERGHPVRAYLDPHAIVEVAVRAGADALVAAAADLPAPLFVKAVAGGGGRGMRRVDDRSQLRAAVETCMREAEGAFGDPTVFIEQAVADPPHIEVQILSDGTGGPDGTIHLFERDCSVQRRHQKVIEIAPAPGLDPELRQRMCA